MSSRLPQDAFYSGDSGVKLIMTRNVIAHPARPFDIDVPAVAGEAAPYMEHSFVLHGGHAHALQSSLFAVITAPFVAVLGLPGAYILPVISFACMLPLVAAMIKGWSPSAGPVFVSAFAIVTSPLLFYGLEFWEHAPAAACLAAATTALLGARADWSLEALGGFLCAIAVLLRPEALWYAAALAAWRFHRGQPLIYSGIAGCLVVAVFAVYNYAEFGNALGPHMAANLAPLGDRWFEARLERAALWFWPQSIAWNVGAGAIIVAWAVLWRGGELRAVQAAALGICAGLALTAAAGGFARESLWNCWPVGLLLLVPARAGSLTRPFWWLAVVSVGAILLTSTHDGGAQWGPRFVLIASPALIALAALNARDLAAPGAYLRTRRALVVLVVLAGVWSSRAAYRELRGTKQFYARIVDAVEESIPPNGIVVFGTWWFDQVVASLYPTRQFLYAKDVAAAGDSCKAGGGGRARGCAGVVREGRDGDSMFAALKGSCYRTVPPLSIAERDIVLVRAFCEGRR